MKIKKNKKNLESIERSVFNVFKLERSVFFYLSLSLHYREKKVSKDTKDTKDTTF